MAIAFVQRGEATGSAVTSIDVTLTGVAAGNLVVLCTMQTGSSNRNLSTEDITNSVSATVAVAETMHSTSASREVAIDYIPSAVGGATTYRLTASGTAVIGLTAFEFSGADASPLDAFDTAEQANSTTIICADGGNIDTVADVAVVFCVAASASIPLGTNPSGYTMSTLTTGMRSGYRVSSGALTNEDATQTSSISRPSIGAIASFKGAASGTTVTPDVATLTLTAYAPTVTATANETYTPSTASLTLAAFAPTVTATANQVATPDTSTLTLTTFAPTADLSNASTVTPGTATLSLTTFAPTVTATANLVATPDTATLSLSAFAPTVSTASASVTVTPDTAALTLTTYAPTLTSVGQSWTIRFVGSESCSGGLTATVTTGSLTISTLEHV